MAEGMGGPWAAIIRLERFVLSALGNMYLQLEIFEQGRKRRCLGRTQNARKRQREKKESTLVLGRKETS